MNTTELDKAIGAVKATTWELRTATPTAIGPADVSAVIGAVRELLWNVTTLSTVIASHYERLGALRHDQGDDPATAVAMIKLRLEDTTTWLTQADQALAATHDHAARLAQP